MEVFVLRLRHGEVRELNTINGLSITELEGGPAHPRHFLPIVVDPSEVFVEVDVQFFIGMRVTVQFKPLLMRTPSNPLLIMRHFKPSSHRPHRMYAGEVAPTDEHGDLNLCH